MENWRRVSVHVVSYTAAANVVARYRGRISGPLLDRIDLLIEVPAVPQDDLMRHTTQGEQSSTIRQRTEHAREVQISRQNKSNNYLSVKEVKNSVCLTHQLKIYLSKQSTVSIYPIVLTTEFSVWHAPSLTFPIKNKLIPPASLKPFNMGV